MKNANWVIAQDWDDVLFIHYEVPVPFLQEITPFPLDLYLEKAFISVVPFKMNRIRFPYLPEVPGISNLWELNLRTYVKFGEIRGVYFFTLDTDSLLGQHIARKFFHLPYNYSQIEAFLSESTYHFHHQRYPWHFKLMAQISNEKKSTHFDKWATERYSLLTFDHEFIYEGRVHHPPWELKNASILSIDNHFTNILGQTPLDDPFSVSYCTKLKVRFSPFKKIGRINDKF